MGAAGSRHSSCAVPWNVPVACQILAWGWGGNLETTMIGGGAVTNITIARDDDGRLDCATQTGLRKGTVAQTSELQTVCSALLGYRSQSGVPALALVRTP